MRHPTKSCKLRKSDLEKVCYPENVRLENNYCRGFQQGLMFLYNSMQYNCKETITKEQVLEAATIAGATRFQKTHQRWYGESFVRKMVKLFGGQL